MQPSTTRDVRLDFYRGLAMHIILIAHIPNNPWSLAIPARFGPSDATEMFVFCSGFASAIAFGGTFARHGFGLGTLRILVRCWQVFWSHVGLFLTVAALSVLGTRWLGIDYVEALNLHPFMAEPATGLVRLLTLSYVPNYFDILPMYLVVLAMVPVAVALARLHPGLAMAAVLGLYTVNQMVGLHLPAEWWSDRTWFFNPFGWQLIFFTGFAFGAGWLSEPPADRRLLWAAWLLVIAMVPLNWQPLWSSTAWLDWFSLQFVPFKDKTEFGPLRYLHFLALAYLAVWAVRGRLELLASRGLRFMVRVGQQALPVFMWSMALAWTLGMVLDQTGRSTLWIAFANLGGLATLSLVALLSERVKAQPWRQPGRARAAPRPEAHELAPQARA